MFALKCVFDRHINFNTKVLPEKAHSTFTLTDHWRYPDNRKTYWKRIRY